MRTARHLDRVLIIFFDSMIYTTGDSEDQEIFVDQTHSLFSFMHFMWSNGDWCQVRKKAHIVVNDPIMLAVLKYSYKEELSGFMQLVSY